MRATLSGVRETAADILQPETSQMPFIYLKFMMATLVIALSVILYMGHRRLRGRTALPRLRLGALFARLRSLPSTLSRTFGRPDPKADRAGIERAKHIASSRHSYGTSAEPAFKAESILQETMRSLEQAFASFEAGRIGEDTYRSLLSAERRSTRRYRAGLAARDENAGSEPSVIEGKMEEAQAAVEAVEWCLDWLDKFEKEREAA